MSQSNFEAKLRVILRAMYVCRSKDMMAKLVKAMKRLEREHPEQARIFWNNA